MTAAPPPTPPGLLPTPAGPLVVPAAAPGSHPGEPPVQLSLVIPTYNESKNVGELVARLCEILDPQLGAGGYELIIVDDDSAD
ncbi:MAG TPA: glycosyltransferase, partial [Polyangia bacterium]|nr:glycosyltransferase [Polyangia bacterium]